MNKITLSFLLIGGVLASIVTAGKYVPLSSNTENNNLKPTISVIKEDSRECVVEVTIPGFKIKEKDIEGKRYTEIELSDDANVDKYGHPALPFVSGILSLPINTTLSVESIEKGTPTTFDNIVVMPAQNQWERNKDKSFLIDRNIYNSTAQYPEQMVEIDTVKIKNGASEYVHIAINPFIYMPSEKKVTVFSTVKITLRKVSTGLAKIASPCNSRLDNIFQNITINSSQNSTGLQKIASSTPKEQKVLLIILPDGKSEYKTIVDEYAKWKHMSGVYTTIVTTEQTGSTIAQIQQYIKKAYEDAAHPLTDVILIGKKNDIISKELKRLQEFTFFSDNYYGCITGNDYIPEVFVARIPVSSSSELKVVIKKLLMYEKTPYMDNTDWYKKAIMCSNNAYESQVTTKKTVADILRNPGGYTVDELMMSVDHSKESPDKEKIISTLTSGRGILNYRGEGWSEGWDAYNGFYDEDLNKINNTNMLTFVTSIGCGVASWFEETGGDGFGEIFLRLGTEQNPRGAITFIGPVSNTNTAYNNNIDRGLYKGLINEGLETPSDVLLRGLAEMYSVFGASDPKVEMHYEEYTVLGDPTLRIYKDIPKRVEIEKPATLPIGQAQCAIKVKNGNSVIKGVTVCGTTNSGIYVVSKTQENGIATLNFKSEKEEKLTIVVKGNSVYPIIDSIPITTKNIYCAPDTGIKIIDNEGNSDGILNPNEKANLEFTIINHGQNTATGVTVSITGPAQLITLNNNLNIPVAEMASGVKQKVTIPCKIAENCSAGTVIQLSMEIKTGTETGTFSIPVTVQACKLSYSALKVSEIGANVNMANRLDPGEKAKVIIVLVNNGKDKAANVTGKLTSGNQYVKITDDAGSFGTILPGGSAENGTDFFTVEVNSSCSTNYYIDATLELKTNNGGYTYSTNVAIRIPVSVLNNSDPTGPDSYGYYMLSSSDTLFKNYPRYTWNEINQKGKKVKINFEMSSAKEIVTLPFEFKFYGKSYSKCVIHANGLISFDESSNISRYKAKLAPESDQFNAFISAYGCLSNELILNDTGSLKSEILYYDDTQNKQFIIEYRNILGRGEFQIVLRDPSLKSTPTGDGEIILYYKSLNIQEDGKINNIVGIENEKESVGLAYFVKKKYNQTACEISSGTALLITTEQPKANEMPVVNPNNPAMFPKSMALYGIFPNPFITNAVIEYSLPKAGNVSISIFNAAGKEVRNFTNGLVQAGKNLAVWDGKDGVGMSVGTGMYIVQINFDGVFKSHQIFKIGK